MKSLTVTVSTTLALEIARVAQRENISKSELMRLALALYLARSAAPVQSRSALDLTGELVGCLRGAPADLASKSEHMKGYGYRLRRRQPL